VNIDIHYKLRIINIYQAVTKLWSNKAKNCIVNIWSVYATSCSLLFLTTETQLYILNAVIEVLRMLRTIRLTRPTTDWPIILEFQSDRIQIVLALYSTDLLWSLKSFTRSDPTRPNWPIVSIALRVNESDQINKNEVCEESGAAMRGMIQV